jgi:hypothetical protein
VLVGVSCAVLMAGTAVGSAAQTPFDDWREPVVVELDLVGGKDGEQLRQLRRGRITLGPNETFIIEVDPFDQRGRRFPRERFQVGVELERGCEGRVRLSETGSGDLRFEAGRSRGRCRAHLWVPGNLNLEYELDFEVVGIANTGYTRRQAEEIAERLYRAIMQREIDQTARTGAIMEIQRGRLSDQVSSMVDSREFALIRQRSQPTELLEAFCEGLLERTPDSAGINDYLREIRRNRHFDAVMNLLRSEEFEASLPTR